MIDLRPFLCLALAFAASLCGVGAAAEKKAPSAATPAVKDPNRHEEFLKVAKAGGVDLLFLGDSITDGWRGGGQAVWNKYFAPLKAANFGISGDRTEHVLWRVMNGELEGITPKLIVLMIGTNNGDSAEDVSAGIAAIIKECHARVPMAKFLLLGIFPRGEKPDGRQRNERVNTIISKMADEQHLVYMDIGDKFLAPDKTLSKDIMPDFLHPNAKGYQIWADAIIDQVKKMLAE